MKTSDFYLMAGVVYSAHWVAKQPNETCLVAAIFFLCLSVISVWIESK